MTPRSLHVAVCLVAVFAAGERLASGNVLQTLATERGWIGYTPRNFNPNFGIEPSQAQMRADLQQLYDAGWRHLYNYTLDGNLQHIPRLAKEVGFETVLAGIFYFDEGQLNREKANSVVQDQWIDGYIVGNEGLIFGRYSLEQLEGAVDFFDGYGKPLATTEVGFSYFTEPGLRTLGDFTMVNIQPWFNSGLNPFNVAGMARATRNELVAIQQLTPDRLVMIKEAWWPTGGHPAATEANQIAFFNALANETEADGDPILFAWGESHDQPWKNEASPFGTLGPDWGFYESNGAPKQIVTDLAGLYTGSVPVNFLPGDFDRDGFVDTDDYLVWLDRFGDEVQIPGSGPDANFDTVIDSADFTIWRDNFAPPAAEGVPEPTTLAAILTCLALIPLPRRGRG